ncbi:DUF4850 domain-containing protein [Saccharibacillus alkalitolerans]|uniref:DUF4850 domain-containing protein n=1 Tax=Saccharibacillus alkalitolerans TaxID=2705290 RepID=A0ABX0F7C5_9BACL|nr:DUF4850 domain-containing protein [Saccharibacillus alkalitolerans]NGZ76285.1 DUF4850 domain-containing protein [Saccharibacillus alkalitolerans]
MTKKDIDWEKELKQKPFRNNSFTPQMMRRVEEKVKETPRRFELWGRRAGVLTLSAALLAGIFALESGGILDGLRQKPPQAAVTLPEGNGPRTPANLGFPLKDGAAGSAVNVPLTVVKANLAVDDGESSDALPELPSVTFALTEEEASALQAALIYRPDGERGYLLLAPRNWTLSEAQVGANGSFGVTWTNPDNSGGSDDPDRSGEKLTYTETGTVGSVVSGIGTYFPERAEWAEQKAFPPETREGMTLRSLYSNDDGTSGFSRYDWTRQGEGAVASGAVYYSLDKRTYGLRHMEMTLRGTAYSGAADTILRFFEANEGAQRTESVPGPNPNEESQKGISIETVKQKLSESGMKLTFRQDRDLPFYDRPMDGVHEEEMIIDRNSADAADFERLTVLSFDSREKAQAEVERIDRTFRSSAGGEGPDIYPHVFSEGGLVILYWTSGSSETPFRYDNKIKGALRALEQSEVQP